MRAAVPSVIWMVMWNPTRDICRPILGGMKNRRGSTSGSDPVLKTVVPESTWFADHVLFFACRAGWQSTLSMAPCAPEFSRGMAPAQTVRKNRILRIPPARIGIAQCAMPAAGSTKKDQCKRTSLDGSKHRQLSISLYSAQRKSKRCGNRPGHSGNHSSGGRVRVATMSIPVSAALQRPSAQQINCYIEKSVIV